MTARDAVKAREDAKKPQPAPKSKKADKVYDAIEKAREATEPVAEAADDLVADG